MDSKHVNTIYWEDTIGKVSNKDEMEREVSRILKILGQGGIK